MSTWPCGHVAVRPKLLNLFISIIIFFKYYNINNITNRSQFARKYPLCHSATRPCRHVAFLDKPKLKAFDKCFAGNFKTHFCYISKKISNFFVFFPFLSTKKIVIVSKQGLDLQEFSLLNNESAS